LVPSGLTQRSKDSIGAQLARDPAHAVLLPHVQEIRRLKSSKGRKKTAPQGPVTPGNPKM